MRQLSLLTLIDAESLDAALWAWATEHNLSATRVRRTVTVATYTTNDGSPAISIDIRGLKHAGHKPVWCGFSGILAGLPKGEWLLCQLNAIADHHWTPTRRAH